MSKTLDSSVFFASDDFYVAEFESILTKIVYCYKMMINNGDTVPNREESIRDVLYIRYINNNEIKNRIKLNYDIVCEAAEYKKEKISGYVDLRISSSNSLIDSAAYYIIECKRLDNKNHKGTSGLNAEYIKNGIMRFVNGQYSTNKNINGIIGFVIELMNISDNIQNINYLIKNHFNDTNTITKLTTADIIQNFKHSYYSIHKRNFDNDTIKLYHLMFDFSKNVVV